MTTRKFPQWKYFFVFAVLILFASCVRQNAAEQSGDRVVGSDKQKNRTQKNKSHTYDFMIFASTEQHNYGMGRIIEGATQQLLTDSYRGVFVQSANKDNKRSLIYDMLSRDQVNVMFFLSEDIFQPEDMFSVRGLALRYPNQKFALPYNLDGGDYNIPNNLRTASIRMEQGAFLAGVIAAKMTRNNRVGMLLDLSDRVSDVTAYAFVQGVRKVNLDCDVIVVRTDPDEDLLENETTRMISVDDVDMMFAMSSNYNDTIIHAAYYFGNDVLLINSWNNADNDWPKHVVASLVISAEPVLRNFMEHAETMRDFESLAPIKMYDLSDEKVMYMSWNGQAHTAFETKRPEYREMSKETRQEVAKWEGLIRSEKFVVYNASENGTPPVELQDFRFRDTRNFESLYER